MRAAVAMLALLPVACATPPPADPGYGPRPVHELQRWEVRAADRPLGHLSLLEIEDPRARIRFYRVEGDAGEWLGFVDLQGRVYQRVPFSMAEVFRGIHTLDGALELLYEEPGPYAFELRERGGRPVEAAARRSSPPELMPGDRR